jgi:hypothetical protein
MKAEKKKEGPAYVTPHYQPCNEPVRKTYNVASESGAYVTFFHENHAKVYGLKCNDCHQDDACISCHYQGQKPLAVVQAKADAMHHKCSACHDITAKNECGNCHSAEKKEEFDHGMASGLKLDENHLELECVDCHADFAKPDCSDCHDDKSYPKERPGDLLKVRSASKKLSADMPKAGLTASTSVLHHQRLSPRSRMRE